jgi:hypothetical protein
LRRKIGWTPEKLAVKMQILGLDVTSELVASFEANRHDLTAKNLVFLTEVFDVELVVVVCRKRNDLS